MMYVRFLLSLRNVEDLLHERGSDVSHETIRFCWNRFGPMFAAEIREKRIDGMRAFSNWRWHVDEVFVKINGVRHYLWRAVDNKGEVLEAVVTRRRLRKAAFKFLRKRTQSGARRRSWSMWESLHRLTRCLESSRSILLAVIRGPPGPPPWLPRWHDSNTLRSGKSAFFDLGAEAVESTCSMLRLRHRPVHRDHVARMSLYHRVRELRSAQSRASMMAAS
jgi:hypothetical protein